jgi:hypothetical protein
MEAMRHTIRIPWPEEPPQGMTVVVPVYVDWFDVPEEHVIANAAALAAGEPEPYPDPNLIRVELTRKP